MAYSRAMVWNIQDESGASCSMPESKAMSKPHQIRTHIQTHTRQAKAWVFILITYVQHCIWNFSGLLRQEKKNECKQIGKEETKLPVFTDDNIIYLENHKQPTNKSFWN